MKLDDLLHKRYNEIMEFYKSNNRVPSYSEMCSLFKVKSKNTVFKTITKLEHLGFVKKDARHITLKPFTSKLKLLGNIEAGFPSPAEEELLDTISIDMLLVKNPNSSFLLKVTGDSMIEAGIMPGDFVIVDKSIIAKEGDIVIACVDNAWTMKYLSKDGDSYILIAANKKYKPIKPKSELTIAGVVVGVARKYK